MPEAQGGLDAVVTEIVRHSLIAIVDQIEANLTRTAYSPLIYEYKDYCVGIVDTQGRLIAQSRGSIPIFLADLGGPVVEAIELYGDEGFNQGDVIISNSVEAQGQHLNNVQMFMPIFSPTNTAPATRGAAVGDSPEVIAFVCIRAHWADLGGRYVGSSSGHDTTEIYHEGVQYPGLKLYRGYKRSDEVFRMVERNTRLPHMVLGDIDAQVAGCLMGERLLGDMLTKYGRDVVFNSVQQIWSQSEQSARESVSRIPDGVYRNSSFLDNDGVRLDQNIPIVVAVTVEGDQLTIDFEGTSPQVLGPFNSGRSGGGVTAAKVAFKYLTTADEPANDGSFRPLHIRLKEGTFLSASSDAAMGRYSTPLATVVDTILGALTDATPERTAAGHHASMGAYVISGISPIDGSLFKHHDTVHGGWGASTGRDGGGPFKTLIHGDTLDIPVEVIEGLYPLRVIANEFVPDTGGAGEWRGGLGTRKVYEVLSECKMSVVFERTQLAPWGAQGGKDAEVGWLEVEKANGRSKTYLKGANIGLDPGDRIIAVSGGGGGWGPAERRTSELVLRDLAYGYITEGNSQLHYQPQIDGGVTSE